MSLLDALKGQLTTEVLGKLAGSVGGDSQKTGSLVQAALPVLVSALAKNSSKPEGAQALDRALAKDHDGGILGDLAGYLGKSQEGPGAGILKHVLGSKQPAVEQEIGKKSGIDAAQVGQILVTLAPIVMGAIGKKKKDEGLDAAGVAAALSAEREQVKQKGEEPSFLEGLLDSDKDGDVMDDIAQHGASLLGSFLKK